MLKLIVFVAFLIGVALSEPDSFSFGGDYCEDSGIKFKKGETVEVPRECMTLTCEEPSINAMTGHRCEEFVPRPGCHKSEPDYSESYPACCPKEVCKN